jgi:O-antigen/teichoic acid export membrane protein
MHDHAARVHAPAPAIAPVVATPTVAAAARALPVMLLQSIVLKFGVVFLNALTGIVTARTLNPTGRGELAALVLWPVLLAGVTTFGLPSALIYHMRRTPERTPALVGTALMMAVATGLVGTLVGWPLVPLWLHQHPASIATAAQYCLLATVVTSISLAGRAAWEARGRFDLSNRSQLVAPVVILAALIPQAWMGVLTSRSAGATYVLAGVPVMVWILASLYRSCRPTWRGAADAWRSLTHFGVRSYGVDLCGMLAVYVDQALVVGLLNPAAMGVYVVALSLSRVINAVHASVAMVIFPRTVGLDTLDLAAAIARSARLGALVTGALGLGVVAVGPMLVRLVYGEAYTAAGHLLPLLVCEVVLAGIVWVLLQGFMAAGRPGVATLVQVGGLALSLPIFLVLVPAFGPMGAAAALLASTAARLVLALIGYRLCLDVATPRVWVGWSDLADLASYRSALFNSFARLRPGAAK